jgi:hypothetical protein
MRAKTTFKNLPHQKKKKKNAKAQTKTQHITSEIKLNRVKIEQKTEQ